MYFSVKDVRRKSSAGVASSIVYKNYVPAVCVWKNINMYRMMKFRVGKVNGTRIYVNIVFIIILAVFTRLNSSEAKVKK